MVVVVFGFVEFQIDYLLLFLILLFLFVAKKKIQLQKIKLGDNFVDFQIPKTEEE